MRLLAELLLLEAETPRQMALHLQQELLDLGFEDVSIKLSDWRPDKEKGDRDKGYLLQCHSDKFAALFGQKTPEQVIYFDFWIWTNHVKHVSSAEVIAFWQDIHPNPSTNSSDHSMGRACNNVAEVIRVLKKTTVGGP